LITRRVKLGVSDWLRLICFVAACQIKRTLRQYACEGTDLRISCGESVIRVTYADYGRLENNGKCSVLGMSAASCHSNVTCIAKKWSANYSWRFTVALIIHYVVIFFCFLILCGSMLMLDLDSNYSQTSTDITAMKRTCTIDVSCSDIIEVVSWLLNEDTEAGDVMALAREFHLGVVLGEKDFWYSVSCTVKWDFLVLWGAEFIHFWIMCAKIIDAGQDLRKLLHKVFCHVFCGPQSTKSSCSSRSTSSGTSNTLPDTSH